MTLVVEVLILVALAGSTVGLYNRLVRLRNASEKAWSDVDFQLERRCDLASDLVSTVQASAQQEQSALDEVTEARTRVIAASELEERASAESALSRALSHLFAVSDGYPELQASQTYLSLQSEISEIEEAVQNARRHYNAVARDLNTRCETFPSVLIARSFGFEQQEYFELDAAIERGAAPVSSESPAR
jgi:LemA protein